ncbi:MAG: septum formation inhibitor Maf [Ruminobacter sp.]|nr:septum formation inhibitor Maf [Ruminobacter sp.]
MSNIILASASPRRRELLRNMGYDFLVIPADIDESRLSSTESPVDYVKRLSMAKAMKILDDNRSSIVIGVDTIVALGMQIYGKPADYEDFKRIMTSLSGQTHLVHTGLSVVSVEKKVNMCVTTEVTFVKLAEKDIEYYWSTGEPKDKAGGYAIQGIGNAFIRKISGSVSSVIGLPQAELRDVFSSFSV